MDNIMKKIMLTTKIIGLLILSSGVNSSFAERIQVSAAFTCSTNAECKKKCEALGSDHTWKPNPGGSTFGTCSKKRQALIGINKHKLSPSPSFGVFVKTDDSYQKLSSRHKLKLMGKKKVMR